jgi:hypothetical protein
MNYPDLINGGFESLGGVFITNHTITVFKDKGYAGLSLISTSFFTLWGIWNLFYYPHLQQYISFYGGVFIVIANLIWILVCVYFGKLNQEARKT